MWNYIFKNVKRCQKIRNRGENFLLEHAKKIEKNYHFSFRLVIEFCHNS